MYGDAADHPERVRRYPSDMTDAEWAAIRPLLPVPGWFQGRGGRPEGYFHRQLLNAIRYLVTGGISRRACAARGLSRLGPGLRLGHPPCPREGRAPARA
ncbi:transposase [Streptomyces sp. NPDC057381]|uniref:transposase n=1 Tax=Streptomyces sp. NPDC057381 TaxID=3346111 RepID=UPI0036356E87